MQDKLFTIPPMGPYTTIFVEALRGLGLHIIVPIPVSDKTNKVGVRNTAAMMCWPLRVTMGSLIQTVKDYEVTDIVTYSTESQCRFRHYGSLYKLALKEFGHNINIHIIRHGHILRDLKKLTKASYWRIWCTFKTVSEIIKEYEYTQDQQYIKADNILLIGEIFSLLEPKVNFHIRDQLVELGMGSILTASLSSFIRESIQGKELYSKEAAQYIDKHVGGHAWENICNILEYKDKKNIYGVIHILPMTCAPECLVMPIIDRICRRAKLPLLRLELDDNASPLNLTMRLESFVDALQMKKSHAKHNIKGVVQCM